MNPPNGHAEDGPQQSATNGSNAVLANGHDPEAKSEASESTFPVLTRRQIQAMNIHQRIAEIKKRCVSIPKSQQNVDEGWYYAGHDQVIDSLRGLMAEFGVNIYQEPLEFTMQEVVGDFILNKVRFEYEVVNADLPEDRFIRHNFGLCYGFDDKAFNKCSTTSEKFFLLRLFSIATFDDPDAHAMPARSANRNPAATKRHSESASPAPRQQVLPRNELLQRIQSLAQPLGPRLYRGILKDVAGKWKPEEVKGALLETVLKHMESAVGGLKRLDSVLAITGPEALAPALDALGIESVDRITSLTTLQDLVSALEKKAETLPKPAA